MAKGCVDRCLVGKETNSLAAEARCKTGGPECDRHDRIIGKRASYLRSSLIYTCVRRSFTGVQ